MEAQLGSSECGAVVGTLHPQVGTSCLLVHRLFDVNSGDVAGSGASTPEANSRQQPLSSVHVHREGSLVFLQLGGASLAPLSVLHGCGL